MLNKYDVIFKVSSLTAIISKGKGAVFEMLSEGKAIKVMGTRQEDGTILAEKIIVTKNGKNRKNKRKS